MKVTDGRKNNHSPVGHRATRHGEQIVLICGNGCRDAPDCFTCPFSDCVWDGVSKWEGEINELPRKL